MTHIKPRLSCKMASCSQESIRSALRRKVLDNHLHHVVSSSSGIYEVEKLIEIHQAYRTVLNSSKLVSNWIFVEVLEFP